MPSQYCQDEMVTGKYEKSSEQNAIYISESVIKVHL